MMMPFICSCRNKNSSRAIYPPRYSHLSSNLLRGNYPVNLFSACVLALATLMLAGLHMGVTDETRAGHVILGRTLLSCTCSLFFAVMLACDANSLK